MSEPSSLHVLAALADAPVLEGNRLEVLTNGEEFYPNELEAIEKAQSSISLEAYIFLRGEIAGRFVEVLSAKARAGVKVHVLLDAIGSAGMALRRGGLNSLRKAGASVRFYRPLHIHGVERLNTRTHREIIVVDGRVAFVGGAGIGDHWYHGTRGSPSWRDTMVRIEGPAVAAIQGVFVENWVEVCGEILAGPEYFPGSSASGNERVLVINSSPRGRSTHARILYQIFLASARESIAIATPYFLPDPSVRGELTAAARRGVDVTIVTSGQKSDHTMTRSGGRRLYGELLEAGVKIYEYHRSMLHVKMMLIDGRWSIVGTTNFDYRSLGINDEINLGIPEPGFADRLRRDLAEDVRNSVQIELPAWRGRPIWERCWEQVSRLLERQQ